MALYFWYQIFSFSDIKKIFNLISEKEFPLSKKDFLTSKIWHFISDIINKWINSKTAAHNYLIYTVLASQKLRVPSSILDIVSIEHPLLNLTGMSHPWEICRSLDEERKNSQNNEGLCSRFVISMPEPVFQYADEVEARPAPHYLCVVYSQSCLQWMNTGRSRTRTRPRPTQGWPCPRANRCRNLPLQTPWRSSFSLQVKCSVTWNIFYQLAFLNICQTVTHLID